MNVCRAEILPALAIVGIAEQAAAAFSIPEPVLDDIAEVARLLPQGCAMPEIEVDEDGTAVLRWFSSDMRRLFSLTFPGLGSVTGYLSGERVDPAWRFPIAEAHRISDRLTHPDVVSLVVSPPRPPTSSP